MKWKDLDIKDKVAIITCCIAFALGWILTIAGFIVDPLGIVSDSVLWILGQSLIYTASVLGIGMYVNHSIRKGLDSIKRQFNTKEDEE